LDCVYWHFKLINEQDYYFLLIKEFLVSLLSPSASVPNSAFFSDVYRQKNLSTTLRFGNSQDKEHHTQHSTVTTLSPDELKLKTSSSLPESDKPDAIPTGESAAKDGKNRLGFFFTAVQTAVTLVVAPAFLLSAAMGARGKTAYIEEMSKKAKEVAEAKVKPADLAKYRVELAEMEKMLSTGRLRLPSLAETQQKTWNPKYWFAKVLQKTTDATLIQSKSTSWIRKGTNALTTKLFNHPLTDQDIERLYKYSKIILTATVFPKALNGIVYGITSQQPSMIFEYIGELLTFPFALAQTPVIQNIIFMMSGLFSLGLANDLDNDKRRAAGDKNLRIYDMTKLKSVFNSKSGLSATERISTLGGETRGMTKFVGEDVLVGLQRITRDIPLIFQHKENEMTNGEGNGGKASLNFLLLQIGTIPKLMLSFMKNDTGPLGQAIKTYSWAMQSLAAFVGSYSVFMLGMKGETMGERIPMVAVTTESAGSVISSGKSEKPLATFLQKMGETGCSIYYAVRSNKLGKEEAKQEKKDQE
jgi:hypothetical protein